MTKPFLSDIIFAVPAEIQIGNIVYSTYTQRDDRESLSQLKEMVFHWCIFNKSLIQKNGKYVPNIESNELADQFHKFLYQVNLKSLCDEAVYDDVISLLMDTDYDMVMSRLVDLHIQIVSEIDPEFVNIYIQKLVYGLKRTNPDTDETITWSDIFNKHPFIWLLFLIQNLMRDCSI